jgi:hypothetical protein
MIPCVHVHELAFRVSFYRGLSIFFSCSCQHLVNAQDVVSRDAAIKIIGIGIWIWAQRCIVVNKTS